MADTKVIDAEPEPPMPDGVHWLSTRITPVVAMVYMCAVVHSVSVSFLLYAGPYTHSGPNMILSLNDPSGPGLSSKLAHLTTCA